MRKQYKEQIFNKISPFSNSFNKSSDKDHSSCFSQDCRRSAVEVLAMFNDNKIIENKKRWTLDSEDNNMILVNA